MAYILMFDVDEDRLRHIASRLDAHDIVCVTRLADAVQAVVARRPDLIVSEWRHSGAEELMAELGRIQEFTPPPVCFMEQVRSSESVSIMDRLARMRGAVGFIPLPIANQEFLAYLSGMLYRVRQMGLDVGDATVIGAAEHEVANQPPPVQMHMEILPDATQRRAPIRPTTRLATYPPQLRLICYEDGGWFEHSSN